jgi:LptD protein
MFLFRLGIALTLFFLVNPTFAQRRPGIPTSGGFGGGGIGGGGFGNSRPGVSTNTQGNNGENLQESLKAKRKLKPKRDSLSVVIPDSLRSRENNLTTTVESFSADSTILDVINQRYHLYNDASVIYGDIELKAEYIMLDWQKSEVLAYGMPDTTKAGKGKIRGKPIFIDGDDAYNSDTIRYNFKSKRALVSNIVTQQGEGFVQGRKVKKDADDNMYLTGAKYTTCNMAEPHFHIKAKKIKLVNKKSLVSGPFNLVLADIPLPIGLPFGFFPIPKKKEIGTSGFIMGNYGEEPNQRGYFLRDFGYYHAFNEYIGVKALGQIYSNGSYGMGVQSTYLRKYRYSGNLNLQFNSNKSGDFNFEEPKPKPARDFNISWSHSPQNNLPDRSFSANVNLVSNGFNRNNRRLDELDQYTNNTFGSSVQYARSFGKLIRTSTGFRVDQNVSTKVMNSSLDYNFALNQFNPFIKEKNQLGNWYDAFRVGIDVNGGYRVSNDITSNTRSTSYTDYKIVGVENRPLTNDELRLQSLGRATNKNVVPLNSRENINYILKDLGQFRSSFSVPITLPNFKLAKYINLTPSFSYRGEIFTKQLNYKFIDSLNAVDVDTSGGFFVAGNWNTSASMNTRVYGTFQFKKLGRLQALRHTIAPSIGIGYSPDQSSNQNIYQKVRVRKDDINLRYLPRFTELGSGSVGANSSINFSISNQLEAKLRSKSDTAESSTEKISILDNLSIGTSYNLLAFKQKYKYLSDSITRGFNLSDINISTNTSLFKNLINVNVNATFDPYTYIKDEGVSSNLAGRKIPVYKWKHTGDPGNYLSNVNLSIGTSFSPDKLKGNKPKPPTSKDPAADAMQKFVQANPLAYVDFSIPWSINISYNISYYKQGLSPAQTTQTAQFNGDLSLTPKWKINFSSGWDFVYKGVTLTNVGIMRELHCWDMSFNWTPIAGNNLRSSNYMFTLQPRSSLLRDLKLSRRRLYYDRGGF